MTAYSSEEAARTLAAATALGPQIRAEAAAIEEGRRLTPLPGC